MKIVCFPHKALTTKAEEVTDFNNELKEIVEQMIDLMKKSKGVGLAANQVNLLKRIVVMDCSEDGVESTPYIFINPVIIDKATSNKDYKEGCLSFPSLYVNVNRPEAVTVEWQDLLGNKRNQEFTGLEAVCIQHEIDHLDGINFVDRISKTKKQMSLLKYSKLKK